MLRPLRRLARSIFRDKCPHHMFLVAPLVLSRLTSPPSRWAPSSRQHIILFMENPHLHHPSILARSII
jgi:hypothetical protein